MGRLIDLTGQQFGELEVVRRATPDEWRGRSGGKVYWLCRCGCGASVVVVSHDLRREGVETCGGNAHQPRGITPGRQFGALRVVERADPAAEAGDGVPRWVCRCDCGATKVVRSYSLLNGKTRTCGDRRHRFGRKLADLRGQRFGVLTVIAPVVDGGRTRWQCRCDCGATKVADGQLLRDGRTRSCGGAVHREGTQTLDLTGRRFGALEVVGLAGYGRRGKGKRARWLCRCDCGGTSEVPGSALTRGNTTSCGAGVHQIGRSLIDLKGQRFGYLRVLGRSRKKRKGTLVVWRVQCDCGAIRHVLGTSLRSGHTRSCGCMRRQVAAENLRSTAGRTPKTTPEPKAKRVGPRIDLTGRRVGALVALRTVGKGGTKGDDYIWACRCDCGRETRVLGCLLRRGGNRTCGCRIAPAVPP